MRFNIGPHIYTVEIAPNPIRHPDNDLELRGFTDHDAKRVWISPTCPLQARLDTLLHELRHNWQETCDLTRDPEEDANRFAAQASSIFLDLERQGGSMALMAMGKDAQQRYELTAMQRTLADFPDCPLVSCHVCQQRVAPGNVLVSAPHADPKTGAMIVDLAFACHGCGHVQKWSEFATMSGRPTGAWAGNPEFLRGDAYTAFCKEHADQCVMYDAV